MDNGQILYLFKQIVIQFCFSCLLRWISIYSHFNFKTTLSYPKNVDLTLSLYFPVHAVHWKGGYLQLSPFFSCIKHTDERERLKLAAEHTHESPRSNLYFYKNISLSVMYILCIAREKWRWTNLYALYELKNGNSNGWPLRLKYKNCAWKT